MSTSTSEFARLRVARAWDEGTLLRAMELDLGGGSYASLYKTPGQYIRARLPGTKEAFFALASLPGAASFELLIQRTTAGEPPKAADAIAALGAGDELESSAPAGKGFPIGAERGRDLLLFAGGSGISAIRSLVEWVVTHRSDYGRTVLLIGARRAADLAYRSHYERWARGGIEVIPVLSRAEPGTWTGRTGYVQEALASLSIEPARSSAFVTGGKPFDAAVTETLGRLGVERVLRNYDTGDCRTWRP